MTDAHLPGRWLNDPTLDLVSDQAWRIHTYALMWSNEQGTDGLIPLRTLRLLHVSGVQLAAVEELVTLGLWVKVGPDFQIVDWGKSQSLAVDVDWQRERNRANQKASRERERGKSRDRRSPPVFTDHVSGDGGGDISDDPGVKDIQGQAKYIEPSENDNSESVNLQTGEVSEPAPEPASEPSPRYEYYNEGNTRKRRLVAA